MAKKPTVQNKRHVAHLAQVQRQIQIIRYTAIAVVVLVVGLIAYGILSQTVLLPLRTVATVNGEKISAGNFQKRAAFTRAQLISQYGQYYQFYQMFGGDPNANPQLTSFLQQIASQLDPSNTEVLGQQVLDNMIDQILIQQEADKLGISVSDDELETRLHDIFGYYPNGTPTPAPSSTPFVTPTLNPTQLALVTITPTASPFPTPTTDPNATVEPSATPFPTPTTDPNATPEPTATPYTLEGFQTQFADVIDSYQSNNVDIDEAFYREMTRSEMLREKLQAEITKDLKPVEEQVWARHILVSTDQEAIAIKIRLQQGEDFGELAKELSLDTGSGALGGDLGWQGSGIYVPEFETAVFSLGVGEVSDPVQTQYGWHIIQVLGKEERPIDNDRFTQLKDKAFTDWLTSIREGAKIDINDFWKEIVPVLPALQ